MRRAMDLIHYVVKDGVKESGGESMALTPYVSEQDGGDTLGHALNVLDSLVDMTRYVPPMIIVNKTITATTKTNFSYQYN